MIFIYLSIHSRAAGSDEKFNYEELVANAKVDTQPLVTPIRMKLMAQYEQLALDYRKELR